MISRLPLSYCTNVHPGRTVAEVLDGLRRFTAPMQSRVAQPVAAGLWLAASVVQDSIVDGGERIRLHETLRELGLVCYTLNTFPYGDFHSPRVKENVYLPDWTDPRRLNYTRDCAHVLAGLLPAGVDGSLSTVPLGFKELASSQRPGHREECIANLLQMARFLGAMAIAGPMIRLAIEPEPFCLLETTPETLAFFEELFREADRRGIGGAAREHLGVCYDVCHQAVEFEDVTESIAALSKAGVRINKVHITCAIELESPRQNLAGREALAGYAEERYLHQTLARTRSGEVLRRVDLTSALAVDPPADFLDAESWRVHFHVPVNLESLGVPGLRTTRRELQEALAAVATLDYAPHLEVETYTWPVLPGASDVAGDERLIAGLTAEMQSTRQLLEYGHSLPFSPL